MKQVGIFRTELPTLVRYNRFGLSETTRDSSEPPLSLLAPPLRTPSPDMYTTREKSLQCLGIALVATLLSLPGCTNDSPEPARTATPEPARTATSAESWSQTTAPIEGRADAKAVWTGQAVFVWGGNNEPGPLADGATYDPETGKWHRVSESPLSARFGHTAVWTGDRVLVWGGRTGAEAANDGASYDPRTDKWTSLPASPLAPRSEHVSVWTGKEMLIWGGLGSDQASEVYSDGAAFDPASGTWQKLPESPLRARTSHSGAWTGSLFIIWGGIDPASDAGIVDYDDGATFDPKEDKWTLLPSVDIDARGGHVEVPTQSGIFVWSGSDKADDLKTDGATYDLESKRWEALPGAPLKGRILASATWSGRRAFVWGGRDLRLIARENGASYDPTRRRWQLLSPAPIDARFAHIAAWTSEGLFVWGGRDEKRWFNDGALLRTDP
jgi:N-acetylneuraminic acid mutarotase